jgi:hypothetical protein
MFVHYFYFLLVLIVAHVTEWDKDIRLYMTLVYLNLCVFTIEISRLIYAKYTNSVIPIYLSLPVFCLLIVLSRSVHQIIMVLWYISFLLVCLQSGSQVMQLHFIIYTIVFQGLYLFMVFNQPNTQVLYVMNNFYTDTCTDVFCGVALTTPIDYRQEVVLVLACLMVVF